MLNELEKKLRDHIAFIYGEASADKITARIIKRLSSFQAAHPNLSVSSLENRVSEQDSILITYGDMVRQGGQLPLQTLAAFLQKYL